MMLHEYQITNFKAFAESQTIPIRPITLIYGPNSSGKSSVLQSLLLLKQTLQEAENPETILLPKGNLVDLGNYREFVHRHDISKPFSLKVILRVDQVDTLASLRNLVANELMETPLLGLQITFTYDEQISNVVFSSVELFLGDDSSPVITYRSEKVSNVNPSPLQWQDLFQVDRRGDFETVLKLNNINPIHSFWQSWWKRAEERLPKAVFTQINETLERIGFGTIPFRGWQEKVTPKLQEVHESLTKLQKQKTDKSPRDEGSENQTEPLEQEVKQIDFSMQLDDEQHQSGDSLEAKLDEIEFLMRFWQRFEDYTLDKAIDDFLKVNQYSFVSYRNFLPFSLGEQREELPNLEIDYLSQIYRGLETSEYLSELTLLTCSVFRHFLESAAYIGPLRDYPERLYIFSGNSSQQVGKSGKMISDLLLKDSELLKMVNEQLDYFGVEYELKIASFTGKETSELSDVFSIRLVDKYTDVNVSLLDVGFGISQILPVIVQSMFSHNKTVLIEQPEIHIHPRLQAQLGSLIAECIKLPFENQFIIETHSEHLMLRLQKLIRQGELKPEHISVIYVDRSTDGSKCLQLRLDEDGDFIDAWPDGFFEEDFNEIFK